MTREVRGDVRNVMQRVFQTFADRIAESREPEAFRVAMADTAAAMELPCFPYLPSDYFSHASY